MAKDPAVLFYTSDFLSGTSFFNHEQRGQYILLLCQQHQLGCIPENHMISICGSLDSPVVRKFARDDNGNFYNERMRLEGERRANFCASRSNDKSGRKKSKIIRKSHDKSHDNHMENENDSANNHKTTLQIKEVFDFFCLTLQKKLILNKDRSRMILARIQEGRTVQDLKQAITNFSKDDWQDRHKFCDLVYAIGIRNKVDNLDKWLQGTKAEPQWAKHPKDCPDCFGNGYETAIGSGQRVPCRRKI